MTAEENNPSEMREAPDAGAHSPSAGLPAADAGSTYAFADLKGQGGNA
jgi:hypothetical protein